MRCGVVDMQNAGTQANYCESPVRVLVTPTRVSMVERQSKQRVPADHEVIGEYVSGGRLVADFGRFTLGSNTVIEIQSLRFRNVLDLIVTASTDHDVSGIVARQGQIAGNEVVRIGQHIGVQENRKSPSCQFYEAVANYCPSLIFVKHSERGWNVALLKLLSEPLSRSDIPRTIVGEYYFHGIPQFI